MAKPKQPTMSDLIARIEELKLELDGLKQQPAAKQSVALQQKGGPRPDVYYVLLAVPDKGLPPQAIVCARVLSAAADAKHIPEAEAMALIEAAKASGRLRTKQGAWHIFQYYRAKLIEGNYLTMQTLDA